METFGIGSVPTFYTFLFHFVRLRRAASRLATLLALPIATFSAIHFKVIGVSCRNRAAMAAFRLPPLRWICNGSSGRPNSPCSSPRGVAQPLWDVPPAGRLDSRRGKGSRILDAEVASHLAKLKCGAITIKCKKWAPTRFRFGRTFVTVFSFRLSSRRTPAHQFNKQNVKSGHRPVSSWSPSVQPKAAVPGNPSMGINSFDPINLGHSTGGIPNNSIL